MSIILKGQYLIYEVLIFVLGFTLCIMYFVLSILLFCFCSDGDALVSSIVRQKEASIVFDVDLIRRSSGGKSGINLSFLFVLFNLSVDK